MARSSDVAKVALWRERLCRWEAAGVKTAEFCQAEGVSPPSFYAWRRKLGERASPPLAGLFPR